MGYIRTGAKRTVVPSVAASAMLVTDSKHCVAWTIASASACARQNLSAVQVVDPFTLSHAVEEVGLELPQRHQPVGLHELLDSRIGLPVRAGDLVAAHMEVPVREQRRHLPEQAIEEGEGLRRDRSVAT
jgi:hypothetical protein